MIELLVEEARHALPPPHDAQCRCDARPVPSTSTPGAPPAQRVRSTAPLLPVCNAPQFETYSWMLKAPENRSGQSSRIGVMRKGSRRLRSHPFRGGVGAGELLFRAHRNRRKRRISTVSQRSIAAILFPGSTAL